MSRFVYIRYFGSIPHLCFTGVKYVEKSVRAGFEEIRDVQSIKFGRI